MNNFVEELEEIIQDTTWADTPLTPEQEARVAESKARIDAGEYYTLEELANVASPR